MNKNRFFDFKNISSSEADLYVYGEIVLEKGIDFWTGEENETDVGLMDFKEELDNIGNVQKLNLYLNSPGGSVFVASTMVSMLQRLKDKGTTIDAYVDGLSASACSFLMMVADNINLYKNSTVMVHKPMSWAIGNVNDMQKEIDKLNKVEDSVMIPLYMNKAKVSEEEIRSLIDAETWLSAKDMDKYFNVTLLDTEKTAVAKVKSDLFKNYKNVPETIKNSLENEEKIEKSTEKEQKEDEIDQKTAENEQKVENKEDLVEKQEKEQEIKAKLGLIRSSLILKNIKKEGN